MEGYSEIITDEFNTMRSMLNEIELKILAVDPLKQIQFYSPIKHMICEAWQDACNKNDPFLFPSDKTRDEEPPDFDGLLDEINNL